MTVSARPAAPVSGRGAPVADGSRLQPARRPRSVPMIAVGVLCSFAGALIFGLIYLGSGDRQQVLAVANSVPPGAVIRQTDLTVVQVSSDGLLRPIPVEQRSSIVGQRATVALAAGSLLTADQVGAAPDVPAGQSVVGLALAPGQFPATLSPGDRVMVVTSPTTAAGAAGAEGAAFTVPEASVYDIATESDPSGATMVSVLVPLTDSSAVSAAAADGRVSLVLLGAP